jgi:hypothetical protein
MSLMTLDEFRLATQLGEDDLPRERAVQAMASASGLANGLTQRYFGHAVEWARTVNSQTHVLVYRHGLAPTGRVYIGGNTPISGARDYAVVDRDTIWLTNVTLQAGVSVTGVRMAVEKSYECRVISGEVVIPEGPIVSVTEVRRRRNTVGIPTDSGTVLLETEWYFAGLPGDPVLDGVIEVSGRTYTTRRRPGYILPVRESNTTDLRVTCFVGYADAVPFDLVEAACKIGKTLVMDISGGQFQSESFEDYSYSRLDPNVVMQLPTSALGVVTRFRKVLR